MYDFDYIKRKKFCNEFKYVNYKKIEIPPKEIPRKKDLNKILDILGKNQFQKEKEKTYVLIHCRHGVNRTGFVICYFLHHRLNIPINDAIEMFETARGHKFYSPRLLKELRDITKF